MAKGSPLIAGSFIQEGPMGVKTVKAIRGFYYDGKQIKVGDVITVPSLFAIGIIAVNKAVEVIAEVKPVIVEDVPGEATPEAGGMIPPPPPPNQMTRWPKKHTPIGGKTNVR